MTGRRYQSTATLYRLVSLIQGIWRTLFILGSTGKPKGVQIEHRSMVNFLSAMGKRPGLASKDVLLAVTTISFDIHVLEIFIPLCVGAKVVIVSRMAATDGNQLYGLI